MSKQSFADFGVSSAVRGALTRRGITAPFPVQRLVLEDALQGHDVLVTAPTGSGKTLAFTIPVVERLDARAATPEALVLAPTRELAQQILGELSDLVAAKGLRAAAVYGGVGVSAQARRAANAHVLVATPGRLEDLLSRGAFTLGQIRTLVLDEADRMLDMGFRPAIDRIVAACPRERQTLLFSATLDGIAGEVARRYTRDAVALRGQRGSEDQPRIEHRFVAVSDGDRLPALVRQLAGDRGRTIVFVRTKRGADRLVKRLAPHGVKAVSIHGDKSQGQRDRALSRFDSGQVDTLVATDVAARGIDVDGVSHVVNFDAPADHHAYIHRVGRTGRAGDRGVGVTLVGEAERDDMRRLARRLGLAHDLDGGERREGRHAAPSRPRRRPRTRAVR